MSQANSHIKWCLAKAHKEIEECKKQGKRIKHRGLILKVPNLEIAKQHLEKAQHNLQATEYLKKGKFADVGASTLFYSMYHCFLAIASKFGYESRNQTCTIALIEWLIEEKKISLDKKFVELLKTEEKEETGIAIKIREEYTYGLNINVEEGNQINELIKNCKELMDKTKEIVLK